VDGSLLHDARPRRPSQPAVLRKERRTAFADARARASRVAPDPSSSAGATRRSARCSRPSSGI